MRLVVVGLQLTGPRGLTTPSRHYFCERLENILRFLECLRLTEHGITVTHAILYKQRIVGLSGGGM